MEAERRIRIGTRGSNLALAQTEQVIARLRERYPGLKIEKVILHTKGDKILDQPLIEFGGKGAFISELEEALQQGRIDLAVHSAKDMPVELADGLTVAGVLPRADARDVLVTRKALYCAEDGEDVSATALVIGTGSLRRQFQLKQIYPDAECISIRGNVPTRLQKIRDGSCDGVVLAAAGLQRSGLLEEPDFDYRFFSCQEMVPAGGQGIIAVEGRADDPLIDFVGSISDWKAELELETERTILKLLDAGCHEAVGVFSRVEDEQIAVSIIRERAGVIYKKQGSTGIADRLTLAKQLTKQLTEALAGN